MSTPSSPLQFLVGADSRGDHWSAQPQMSRRAPTRFDQMESMCLEQKGAVRVDHLESGHRRHPVGCKSDGFHAKKECTVSAAALQDPLKHSRALLMNYQGFMIYIQHAKVIQTFGSFPSSQVDFGMSRTHTPWASNSYLSYHMSIQVETCMNLVRG